MVPDSLRAPLPRRLRIAPRVCMRAALRCFTEMDRSKDTRRFYNSAAFARGLQLCTVPLFTARHYSWAGLHVCQRVVAAMHVSLFWCALSGT